MKWVGTDVQVTPVSEIPGQSEYQQNTRMQIEGELQRRFGYQSSLIAKQAGAILNIASAYVASGNYLTFDIDDASGGGSGPGGTVGGEVIPRPPLPPKQPIPPNGGTCIRWGPFVASGDFNGGAGSFDLPALGSCAGTWLFTVTDPGPGPFYGLTLGGSASSGCISAGSATGSVPAGTTTFTYTVSGGCGGGGTTPTWTLTLTQP